MKPALREAASRITSRVMGSRFAKPVTRLVLAAAGLFLLAFIGKTAVAGAMGATSPAMVPSAVVAAAAEAMSAPAALPAAPAMPPAATAVAASPPDHGPAPPSSHGTATADDPVFLNTATIDDLRRLPGIGEKRATSIVALRTRLGGRFHVIEDLLKVKGIGRTTLRRLRPLVRLDPPPAPSTGSDAGLDEPPR
jgi:competence protein ComEA